MRLAVIYNPVSGRGAGRRVAARLAAIAAARGDRIDLHGTGRELDARTAARRAVEAGAERIAAVGGDGTVVGVAAGLLEVPDPPPIGIVPQGTANLLALNLGIPSDPEASVTGVFSETLARLDCGRVNGEPFLIGAGAGLHADFVARAGRTAKRRWGVAAYGIAGWRAGLGAAPARFRVVADGVEEEIEATSIQVMNVGSILRRGWEFAPGISPFDGVLDLVALRASTLAEHIVTAAAVVRGTGPASDLLLHRAVRTLRIEVDPAVPLQRDGEPAGTTPVEIDLLPGALPFVLPASTT